MLYKNFIILYLFLLVIFLLNINTSNAIVCDGACFDSGVCCGGVQFEGCEDNSGNLYCPDAFLADGDGNDCLKCNCVGSACDWQPSFSTCTINFGSDYICDYDASTPPGSSTCVDRDESSSFCSDSTCTASAAWTNAGEDNIPPSYTPEVWEYVGGDTTTVACCGDDSSEFFVSTGVGPSTCCNSGSSCVDSGGICRANIAEDTVALCSDGIDNNCNGLIDCAEASCAGTISGNVQDPEAQNLFGATVEATQLTVVKHTELTDTSGDYVMSNVLCGTYDMIASSSGYVSSTILGVVMPPLGSVTVNFTGANSLVEGTLCEDDCTFAGDNTIHQECDTINGCFFFDATARTVCDLAQPGWIRQYSETQEIECAEGAPQDIIEVAATVTCDEDNLIKITKLVTYKGRLVKLVVVACGP